MILGSFDSVVVQHTLPHTNEPATHYGQSHNLGILFREGDTLRSLSY